MRIKRTIGAVVMAAALATGVAACGDDEDNEAASAGSSTQATTTAKPSGPAFKIGAICSCSGAQAAALKDLEAVSKAWAAKVNAAGGINGHPVEIVVKDDGGNAATARKQVKELVETEKIQALVGNVSLQDAVWADYISEKGVPVLGGLANSTPFLMNPNFTASGGNLPMVLVGLTALAKEAGKKKFGIMYCAETPACAEVVPLAKGVVQLTGMGLESAKISATQASYAAPCLAMKEKGVEAMYIAHNADIVERVYEACAQQGFKPTITADAATVAGTWLENDLFDGTLLAGPNANYQDTSIAGVAEFRKALEEFAPGVDVDTMSYTTVFPWTAGKLFEAVAEAGKLTPESTPAEVKAAVVKANGTDLDGMSAPLPIVEGRPVFSPCYFTMKLEGGKFVSTNDGKPTCLPEEQAQGLQAALAKGAKQ